jgi:hypothetical protein
MMAHALPRWYAVGMRPARLMTRFALPLLIACLACAGVLASERTSLHLKNGDVLEVYVLEVNEEAVKVRMNGLEIAVRWTFLRGDRHLDLRRQALDEDDVGSLMRFADFCREFVLVDEERETLTRVLTLAPGHVQAQERMRAMPTPDTEPEDEPEPEPTPAEPAPEPEDRRLRVRVDSADGTAVQWLKRELERLDFRVVDDDEYAVRIVLEIDLKLVDNPRFMGADVYAVYDGELRYRFFKPGASEHYVRYAEEAKGIRRDSRPEAESQTRISLLGDALPTIVTTLQDANR